MLQSFGKKKYQSIYKYVLAWLPHLFRDAFPITAEETSTSRQGIKTTFFSLPCDIMISNKDSFRNEATLIICLAISYNKIPEDIHTIQTIKN